MTPEILEKLFCEATGCEPVTSLELMGAGSARKYYRLTGSDGNTLIGTVGTNGSENRAFIYLSHRFAGQGLHVPQVVAVSADSMAYLQTDLGNRSLFDLIKTEPQSATTKGIIRETLSRLPDIQFGGDRGLDYSRCYPVGEFDERAIMWDLNYFKYCFLKTTETEFDECALEDDFVTLATRLMEQTPRAFMYRDFQSRNIMVHSGAPWFIDFQSGRRGPVLYDLVSFLWQARAGFSCEERHEYTDEYLRSAARYQRIHDVDTKIELMALFRTMQVLGAYGFRGVLQQKAHFIESIAPALDNLQTLLDVSMLKDCPHLSDVLRRVAALPQFHRAAPTGELTVEVNSFGYRKSGIPRDYTGNGGGFVFDCRAISNPGRNPEFATLTGRDEPVVRFLEERGETREFLNHALALVDASVERYLERGFTSLKVSFGCTGGRHRSVYCAEQTARHLQSKYGVRVILNHTEHKDLLQ